MQRIILYIVSLLILAACHNDHQGDPMRWPLVDIGFDSISQQIDRQMYLGHKPVELQPLFAKADSIAKLHPTDVRLRNRVDFFNAVFQRRYGSRNTGDSLLSVLETTVDSASQPYLFNRIRYLLDDYTEETVSTHDLILQRLKFFEDCGDDFHTAALYMDLGNLMKNVRDPESAVSAYYKSDSLYRVCGFDTIAICNMVNLASALTVKGDTASAIGILRKLEADSAIMEGNLIRNIVYSHLFQYAADTTALDKLYTIECRSGRHNAFTLVAMADRYMESRNPDAAFVFACQAFDLACEDSNADAAAWALYTGSDALAALGDSAQAYQWLKEASELTDQIALDNDSEQLKQIETLRALDSARLEASLAESRKMLHIVIVGFLLLVLLGFAVWFVTLRIRLLKRSRITARQERDQVSRRLVATEVARDETRQMIDNVSRRIGDMNERGQLPGNDTLRIINSLKTHSQRQDDRQTFIEAFTVTHPEFAEKLRRINPAFTELDIRLASYIVMGMDTKHIAATMGILPESVKQARWRIRSKLGLDRSDSLENALRNL